MGTYTARDRAREALISLAGGEPDSDSFRHEAIAILGRAVGVDGWAWLLTDPGARLPTRDFSEYVVVDQALRRFFLMVPRSWDQPAEPAGRPQWERSAASVLPATTLSAATAGDLQQDLGWREVFGPAGIGDKMRVQLTAGGVCWALLHLHRDASSGHYSEDDTEFVADVPLGGHPGRTACHRIAGPGRLRRHPRGRPRRGPGAAAHAGLGTHAPRAGGGAAGDRRTVDRGHGGGAVHLREHHPRPPQGDLRQGGRHPPPGPGRRPHRRDIHPAPLTSRSL